MNLALFYEISPVRSTLFVASESGKNNEDVRSEYHGLLKKFDIPYNEKYLFRFFDEDE